MTTQDLTNNKERIIKKINTQISSATMENIKGVMNAMVSMLPKFLDKKATMSNIDKLTMDAINYYLKFEIKFTQKQEIIIDARIAQNKIDSLQSSLR